MKEETTKGHGGKREGSGAKKLDPQDRLKVTTVSLPQYQLAYLRSCRGSMSKNIRDLIDRAIEEEGRGPDDPGIAA